MQISNNAMAGLKKLTIAHILRSVFGNTPCCCSSTKLAELSKPDIPNMAAENPRNKAFIMVPEVMGRFQFRLKTSNPFMKMNQTEVATNNVRVVKCVIKITTATIADSPIPTIANPVKISNMIIVAIGILIPGAMLCK